MSLLTDIESDPAADSSVISSRSKEQAKAIADEWKPKLDHLDTEACYGNSLEAHAFLQLLATFGIVSEFNQHELCKLIPLVSRRRQTAELCRFLGLTEKMPGWFCLDLCISWLRFLDVSFLWSWHCIDFVIGSLHCAACMLSLIYLWIFNTFCSSEMIKLQ